MQRKLALAFALLTTLAALLAATALAANGGSAFVPPVRDTAGDTPGFTEQGGVTPLADAKTVDHWSGSYVDGSNGQTYNFTMVGHKPSDNSTSTTPTDIVPVNVSFNSAGGYSLDGTSQVAAAIGSPIFQSNNYSSVTASSGGAGVLSPGNVGQLEDVTMRSQFNRVSTGYHVNLGQPVVHGTESISVPAGKGFVFQNSRGIIYGLVDASWFSTRVMEILGKTQMDSTHLPILLTNNVMLYDGTLANCCIIGYHGAAMPVGRGAGSTNGNGKQQVQTFIYAAYTTRGLFGNGYVADIHALSHEVAEWGDDPFVNNFVNPWLTPTAPQYGCTGILETGDPVVGIGFKIGANTFDTGAFADGFFHPEDEVFLPWFARTSPNTISEPTQAPSPNIGRYTLMGDLNPFPGFRQPATGC